MFRVFLFLTVLIPSAAYAIDYTPLVNLPFVGSEGPTTGGYLVAIFKLLIGLAGIIAVVRLVLCGFKAIVSPIPSARHDANECVLGVVSGLLLIFSSWIILDQINPKILSTEFAPPTIIGNTGNSSGDGQPGAPVDCGSANLCSGNSPGQTLCFSANAACAPYAAYADRYAGGGINASVLREVMAQESSCNIGQTNPISGACGLMQLVPSTAQVYRGACGVTSQIDCAWLRNPANAEASVCLAAAYLRSLQSGICGGGIRQVLAGYNGGFGACQMSQDCASMQSCDGGSVRRWECPYDNPQHTICNKDRTSGNYEETRRYVPEILTCLQ